MPTPEDQQFARAAARLKFVKPEHIEQCLQILATDEGVGAPPRTLAQAMIAQGCITPMQVDLIAEEQAKAERPTRIGPYEAVTKLGEGGMGAVYKAKDTRTGTYVALKVLPPNLAKDEKFTSRFRREAEIGLTLDHAHIVHTLDVGEARGLRFIALELCEGGDARKLLKREIFIAEDRALEIVRDVAKGLQYAHEKQLVHRDVKPDNILFTLDGQAKIGDFGLIRSTDLEQSFLTQSGIAVGTPHYIAPEQARGSKDVDIRADIYSLGATLYHFVTGETPFQADSPLAVMRKHVDEQLRAPDELNALLSDGCVTLIERMMAKDLDDRYQTPAQLLEDIEKVQQGQSLDDDTLQEGRSSVMMSVKRRERLKARGRYGRQATARRQPVRGDRRGGAHGRPSGGRKSQRADAPPPSGSGSGMVIGGVVGVLAVVGVVALMLGGGDKGGDRHGSRGPAKPPNTRTVRTKTPSKPKGQTAESARKAFAFAEKHVKDHPDAFAQGIEYLEQAKDAARKADLADVVMKADQAVKAVRADWLDKAGAVLAALKTESDAMAATGDFDGALKTLASMPENLREPIRPQWEAVKTAVKSAADARVAALAGEARALAKDGETDTARQRVEALINLRYAEAKARIRADIEALTVEIAKAEQEKESAEARKAAEKEERAWERIVRLIDAGDHAGAQRALADPDVAVPASERLKAARGVVGHLAVRETTIRASLTARIGKTESFVVGVKTRTGRIEAVTDAGIEAVTEIKINGRVRGTRPLKISWPDLSLADSQRWSRDWKPDGEDGAIARALVAVADKDPASARKALADAGAHALAGHVRGRIDVLELGAAEAAAKAAWAKVLSRIPAGGRRIPEPLAKKKLDELMKFLSVHGGTKFAAGLADEIAALKERLESSIGPPKRLVLDLGGGVRMELLLIAAGEFMMGSPDTEPGHEGDEGPVHKVRITKPFYMGKTEVTRGQFAAFVKATKYKTEAEQKGSAWARPPDGRWRHTKGVNWLNPMFFTQDDTHPAVCISWNDAQAFCKWVTAKTKRPIRLPTEAQWEYACRAGTKTKFSFGEQDSGLGEHAWYNANSGMKTHPVGGKKPNPWGLHDIHGNVWEWVQDKHSGGWYAKSPPDDPTNETDGGNRVLRGGSWANDPRGCRSAARSGHYPDDRNNGFGFRVVVSLGPPKQLVLDLGGGVTMELVLIPAGEFMMGSPGTEKGRKGGEGPVHRVQITKPFYLGKYEVTQAQWQAVMGVNPSKWKGESLPVEQVSWNDCQAFMRQATVKVGRTVRSPTEAEWEYACRAGTTTTFSSGDRAFLQAVENNLGDFAWLKGNCGRATHPVGGKKPNPWGLHDVHGNVWEWVQDKYSKGWYAKSPTDDPTYEADGGARVLRGGAWNCIPASCRSAIRHRSAPSLRFSFAGLRVALSVSPRP